MALPDVSNFKLRENVHDFILIASDGIFDRLSTEEVVKAIYDMNNKPVSSKHATNVNELCGESVDRVLRLAMQKESYDNLSVVLIAFKNFTKHLD